MELETDKAVVEVPSSVSGVVKEVKVREGEKIKVGQVIFTLEGGQRRLKPKRHVRGTLRSNMFPDSTARVWRFRPRFVPRARRKSRLCRPINRSKRARLHSACRCNWARLPVLSIASRLRPRRMFGDLPARSALTFTK